MASQGERPPTREGVARDVVVVHLGGQKAPPHEGILDRIHDQLLALADESSQSNLLLDFGDLECVSSQILGTLVGLHERLLARGRRLSFANLSRQVHEVFAATGLDKFLSIPGQEAGPDVQDRPPPSHAGVLVVDDEPAVLCVLEARLRSAGFKVWSADQGRQAVELYERHLSEIAVVLLDVRMPGTDGPQTLAALRKLTPAVRCCFMTGDPAPYTEEALLRMGAARVFLKPFAFDEVIDTLSELVSQAPRGRQDRGMESHRTGV
jgi:anti-anti-sigma factor